MTFCFIMLRHIENDIHNNFWIESYKSIRQFYKNKIYILDNNSNFDFINYNFELENCEVIKSEIPQTRLFAPFYYYVKYINDTKTVIIHDGVIFREHIDFDNIDKVKYLWHFETHLYDNYNLEINMLKNLNNSQKLIDLYHNKQWNGCMGCMTFITKDFIMELQNNYNLLNLTTLINNQTDAIAFERILSVLCFDRFNLSNKSLLGDISNMVWGYNLDCLYKERKENIISKPIVKLFGGRK